MKKKLTDLEKLQRRSRRKDKVIAVLCFVIAAGAFFPMVSASTVSDTLATYLGVDLTTALISGLSAGTTSLASFVGIYRLVKKPIKQTIDDSGELLTVLKEKIEAVVSGEKTIEEFIGESKQMFLSYKDSLDQMFAALKDENGELRKEIATLTEQLVTLKSTYTKISQDTVDVKTILLLIGSNLPELVKNGIANKINKVGESTDEAEY